MRRIAVWFLVVLSATPLLGQSGSEDFGLKDPSKAVCDVVGSKLREAGTDKIVLFITLDKKGRVRSFKVVSPKDFEKNEEAANTIKSLHFKSVPKDNQITAQFDCAESRPHWSVAPRLIQSVDPKYPDSAIRDEIRGTVSVQLTIQVDGVPKDVKIEELLHRRDHWPDADGGAAAAFHRVAKAASSLCERGDHGDGTSGTVPPAWRNFLRHIYSAHDVRGW